MHLRALLATQINTAKGLVFVNGPEETEEGITAHGSVVEVDNDFVVNPVVWEVVAVDGKGRVTEVLPNPVDGVTYFEPEVQDEPAPRKHRKAAVSAEK